MTRRRFLAVTAAGLAEAALSLPVLVSPAKAASASDKLVVAHIGVGGMGKGHVGWFAGFDDVETAAVCDVNESHAVEALAKLKQIRPDTKAVVETDFRRLLDRKDIDIITCATPDHWHALIAVCAFQAGKHVYGEKPLSYDIAEGQAMLKACRRYQRTFQLGTQIHATDNYHRVVELVRSGVLGKIHTVRMWRKGGGVVSGYEQPEQVPPGLNWDMWLGPAPWREYNPVVCSGQFRYFWDYSTGMFGDFWCHLADLPYWALKPGAPKWVSASGDDNLGSASTTPQFLDAEFHYDDLTMYWHSRVPDIKGADDRTLGVQFVGTNGEMVADYERRMLYIDGKEYDDIPEIPVTLPRSPGHQRNFLDCVKSGDQPESNIAYAASMTLPLHLACISYRLGRKVEWDAVGGKFVSDDAANTMRHRPYRAPWSLPGV